MKEQYLLWYCAASFFYCLLWFALTVTTMKVVTNYAKEIKTPGNGDCALILAMLLFIVVSVLTCCYYASRCTKTMIAPDVVWYESDVYKGYYAEPTRSDNHSR